MRMRTRLLLVTIGATAIWLSGASAAWAGGWAVTSVDGVPPTVEPGAPVDVDLLVLQHGRTPADGVDVAIVVGPVDGQQLRFPAEPTGEPGRYRARMTVDVAGTWPWLVDQGRFGRQPLGDLDVGASTSGTVGTDGARPTVPLALRVALTGAAGLALVVAVGTWRRRPARRSAAAT